VDASRRDDVATVSLDVDDATGLTFEFRIEWVEAGLWAGEPVVEVSAASGSHAQRGRGQVLFCPGDGPFIIEVDDGNA